MIPTLNPNLTLPKSVPPLILPTQVFAEHDKVKQFEKILEIIKDKARSTL